MGTNITSGRAVRPSSLQPRLPDRMATALGRYRRGGRRSRVMRRLLAVALLVGAGALALSVPTSAADGTVVYTAAHDLAVGTALTAADVTTVRVRSPPSGALPGSADLSGRLTAGAVRRGEILTDVRLVSNRGPDPGPGRAAVPIPLSDNGVLALLHPGVHVALVGLISDGTDAQAHRLTDDAIVLELPKTTSSGPTSQSRDPLVVLAVPKDVADEVTTAALTGTVALRFTS